MPVILATQEVHQKDRGSKPPLGQIVHKTLSQKKKPITEIGLVEKLKVKALSSNPSTTHTKSTLTSLS
jgi:hypothetical protein